MHTLQQNVTIPIMPSLLVHFWNTFTNRILRTTREKWIDGTLIVLTGFLPVVHRQADQFLGNGRTFHLVTVRHYRSAFAIDDGPSLEGDVRASNRSRD